MGLSGGNGRFIIYHLNLIKNPVPSKIPLAGEDLALGSGHKGRAQGSRHRAQGKDNQREPKLSVLGVKSQVSGVRKKKHRS